MKGDTIETSGIFIFDENENFLVCHPTNMSGALWSIPKGIPEKNESYLEAAIRELCEETGIELTKEQVQRVAFVGGYEYPDKNKILYAHVLFLEDDPVKTDLDCISLYTCKRTGKQYPEVDGYYWMSVNQSIFVNCSQKKALERIIKNYRLKYCRETWIGELNEKEIC